MERFPDVLDALLGGLDDAAWRRRPSDGAWSLVEVLGHLVDEETDDFGTRLRMTLETPELPWPRFDPQARVRERDFQSRDPAEGLARFRALRAASVAWLRGLTDARWDTAHEEAGFPPMPAGDLLASWCAHDARHLEQIGKRLYELAAADAAPYSVLYAG